LRNFNKGLSEKADRAGIPVPKKQDSVIERLRRAKETLVSAGRSWTRSELAWHNYELFLEANRLGIEPPVMPPFQVEQWTENRIRFFLMEAYEKLTADNEIDETRLTRRKIAVKMYYMARDESLKLGEAIRNRARRKKLTAADYILTLEVIPRYRFSELPKNVLDKIYQVSEERAILLGNGIFWTKVVWFLLLAVSISQFVSSPASAIMTAMTGFAVFNGGEEPNKGDNRLAKYLLYLAEKRFSGNSVDGHDLSLEELGTLDFWEIMFLKGPYEKESGRVAKVIERLMASAKAMGKALSLLDAQDIVAMASGVFDAPSLSEERVIEEYVGVSDVKWNFARKLYRFLYRAGPEWMDIDLMKRGKFWKVSGFSGKERRYILTTINKIGMSDWNVLENVPPEKKAQTLIAVMVRSFYDIGLSYKEHVQWIQDHPEVIKEKSTDEYLDLLFVEVRKVIKVYIGENENIRNALQKMAIREEWYWEDQGFFRDEAIMISEAVDAVLGRIDVDKPMTELLRELPGQMKGRFFGLEFTKIPVSLGEEDLMALPEPGDQEYSEASYVVEYLRNRWFKEGGGLRNLVFSAQGNFTEKNFWMGKNKDIFGQDLEKEKFSERGARLLAETAKYVRALTNNRAMDPYRELELIYGVLEFYESKKMAPESEAEIQDFLSDSGEKWPDYDKTVPSQRGLFRGSGRRGDSGMLYPALAVVVVVMTLGFWGLWPEIRTALKNIPEDAGAFTALGILCAPLLLRSKRFLARWLFSSKGLREDVISQEDPFEIRKRLERFIPDNTLERLENAANAGRRSDKEKASLFAFMLRRSLLEMSITARELASLGHTESLRSSGQVQADLMRLYANDIEKAKKIHIKTRFSDIRMGEDLAFIESLRERLAAEEAGRPVLRMDIPEVLGQREFKFIARSIENRMRFMESVNKEKNGSIGIVIEELLSNVRDHGRGGELKIYAEISPDGLQETLRVVVTDNGSGLSRDPNVLTRESLRSYGSMSMGRSDKLTGEGRGFASIAIRPDEVVIEYGNNRFVRKKDEKVILAGGSLEYFTREDMVSGPRDGSRFEVTFFLVDRRQDAASVSAENSEGAPGEDTDTPEDDEGDSPGNISSPLVDKGEGGMDSAPSALDLEAPETEDIADVKASYYYLRDMHIPEEVTKKLMDSLLSGCLDNDKKLVLVFDTGIYDPNALRFVRALENLKNRGLLGNFGRGLDVIADTSQNLGDRLDKYLGTGDARVLMFAPLRYDESTGKKDDRQTSLEAIAEYKNVQAVFINEKNFKEGYYYPLIEIVELALVESFFEGTIGSPGKIRHISNILRELRVDAGELNIDLGSIYKNDMGYIIVAIIPSIKEYSRPGALSRSAHLADLVRKAL